MIVVSLVAVLAAVAAPSFIGSGRPARVDAVASELAEVLKLARTEASRRGLPVYLSGSNGLDADTDWNQGWRLWVDDNRNETYNANKPQVIVKQITDQRMRVVRPNGVNLPLGFGNSVFLDEFDGLAAGIPISFFVCETGNGYAVEVQLLRSGNVVIRPPQQAYNCPN